MARYQPFTLQVYRQNVSMKPLITAATTPADPPDNQPFLDGDYEKSEGLSTATYTDSKNAMRPGLLKVLMGLLFLLSTALLFSLIFFAEGRLNTWTNAKTMHYTRNKNIFSWVSIFPSQVYTNQIPAHLNQHYKVVDAVMDHESPAETRGFQIAGGFGILTNISSNVYLSALIAIYVLSALDSALSGVDFDSMKVYRPIYFTWVTIGFGVFFVLIHMFQKFGTWHDVEWGSGTNKISVKFSWEAGASLLYASVVLTLYIVHLNVKNNIWHALIPSAIEDDMESKYKKVGRRLMLMIGTEDSGPATKEANVLFAVSLFLLAMGVLGDTRSIVLETDAQLVVLCTFSLAVLTLLSMRVRMYFEWTKQHFLNEHEDYIAMINFVLQLVDVLVITVSGVLLSISIHVLATMFESKNYNLLYVCFVIVTSVYFFIRVLQLLAGFLNSQVTGAFKNVLNKWWDHVYLAQSVFSTVFILVLLFAFAFTENHGHDKLRKLESMQHFGMHKSDVSANTNCSPSGVQNNALLHDFMNVPADAKYNEISSGTDNPVSFKVFAWTRWWQLELRQTGGKKGPALYFCSNGLEQEFGLCAAEFTPTARPGLKYEDSFQLFVDKVNINNLN